MQKETQTVTHKYNGFLISDESLNITNKEKEIKKTKDIKHKIIYIHLNKELVPNVKLKWEHELEIHIDWERVWDLCNSPLPTKLKQFQWKSVHNIVYTEVRLQIGNLSNAKCNLCKLENEDQIHMFLTCRKIQTIVEKINIFFKNITNTDCQLLTKTNVILGIQYTENEMETNLGNFILLTYKWVIWKARNDTKYNNNTYSDNITYTNIMYALKENINLYENFKPQKTYMDTDIVDVTKREIDISLE